MGYRRGKNGERADEVLDVRGLFCPLPIVKTSEKLKTMEEGKTLLVLSDDEGIVNDMPAWCEGSGNTLVGIEVVDGVYRCLVRKGRE